MSFLTNTISILFIKLYNLWLAKEAQRGKLWFEIYFDTLNKTNYKMAVVVLQQKL